MFRLALAQLPFPGTPAESVTRARQAIDEAAAAGAQIICFPECYVPGYRDPARRVPPPQQSFLEEAWTTLANNSKIAIILGTERIVDNQLRASALVTDANGTRLGFQDKVQIDPSEEGLYTPAADRQIFQTAGLTFGIVICHEGWRYPETVRWAAHRGAQVVFHPHFHEAAPTPTYHQKAVACRAAENTCYFATVNYASPNSATTSAIANPEGEVTHQLPAGQEGLLIADIDLTAATGLLARRCKY